MLKAVLEDLPPFPQGRAEVRRRLREFGDADAPGEVVAPEMTGSPPVSRQASRQVGPLRTWGFALLALLYAFAIHHGIGPAPLARELHWYQPRGYLLAWDGLAWAFEPGERALVVFTLPVLLLAAAVFVSGRSALARALALSSVVATFLFLFYGQLATRIWQLFFWRGSAVMALMTSATGRSASILAASRRTHAW